MKIERVWAMPNKWTFTIKPIRELLEEEISGDMWLDPFAGYNSPVTMTNDLDKNAPTHSHIDALEFLKKIKGGVADGILYDPPYSITQARQYGKKEYASMKYWKEVKDELTRLTKVGGKAICFGWSSMGLGKSRGYKMERILLVPHGGSKNDTIVTVEIKT